MILPSLRDTQNALKTPRVIVLDVHDRVDPERLLRSVLVERVETYSKAPNGALIRASIELSYDSIPDTGSTGKPWAIRAEYSAQDNSLSLVSGGLFIDLPALQVQRLGTYLMHCIVKWAYQWPDATVQSLALQSGQGVGENKIRRNRLYERIGLVFEYDDDSKASGRSLPIPVDTLEMVTSWQQNIHELSVPDYLKRADEKRSELSHHKQVIRQLVDERTVAESAPLRWALRQLWRRHAYLVLTSLVVSFFAAVIWIRY